MIEDFLVGSFVIIAIISIVGMVWYEILTIPSPQEYRTGIFRIYRSEKNDLYWAKIFIGKIFWIIPVWIDLETVKTDTCSIKYWRSKEKLIEFLGQQYEQHEREHKHDDFIEEINLRKKN